LIDEIARGRTDRVFDWTEAGGDPRATDEAGTPIIRWCAYYGDVSAIRHLIGHGESLDRLGGNLDLNGAAFHGHWQLCAFLIEQGADANAALPETGETPLHAAASTQRPAAELVVQVMLAAGADPNRATIPNRETGSFMRDCRTKGETSLHRAAAFGSAAMVEQLLAAGADATARDMNGDSPLSWASWHRRPSAVLRLLTFPPHRLHPDAEWSGDHGHGRGGLDSYLLGAPNPPRNGEGD
jgi:ankyrin repeat protein